MFNEKQCNLLIFFFTAATVIAIFFSTSYIKNHRRRLFQKKSRHQPSATCHYIADTRCLTSATLERYVRRETSVTVPSRLNTPIALWWLNNLTLPSLVGLKLSTWQLESVARLISTSLTMALYCPLHRQFRSFKMGILAMWMMENARFLSEQLFLVELSPCRKCHGIYRRREQSRVLSSQLKTDPHKKELNSALEVSNAVRIQRKTRKG